MTQITVVAATTNHQPDPYNRYSDRWRPTIHNTNNTQWIFIVLLLCNKYSLSKHFSYFFFALAHLLTKLRFIRETLIYEYFGVLTVANVVTN